MILVTQLRYKYYRKKIKMFNILPNQKPDNDCFFPLYLNRITCQVFIIIKSNIAKTILRQYHPLCPQ